MICPYCANEKTIVCATVKALDVERFRKCPKCGKTFQTIEAIKFDDYWKEYAKSIHEDKDKKDER